MRQTFNTFCSLCRLKVKYLSFHRKSTGCFVRDLNRIKSISGVKNSATFITKIYSHADNLEPIKEVIFIDYYIKKGLITV